MKKRGPSRIAVAILGSAVLAALSAVSLYRVWLQRHMLHDHVATGVEVVSARVEKFSGRGGSKYRPVIRYRYRIDGEQHESEKVTPLDSGNSESWAQGVVADFAPGTRATAWIDPDDPSCIYLLQHHDISSHFGSLMAAGTLALWLFLASAKRRQRSLVERTRWKWGLQIWLHAVGLVVVLDLSSMGADAIECRFVGTYYVAVLAALVYGFVKSQRGRPGRAVHA